MSGTINITTDLGAEPQVIQLQLPGAPGPAGPQGIPGQANVVSIGTVTTSAPGTNASATITGVSPNQSLNLTIPQGAVGATGPANTLTIGTVNTVNGTTGGSATITGTSPNQVLNLVLPRGYGVNPGGVAGDVLLKNSGTDYDVKWSTPTSAGTASTVMLRDASGRAQVADPSVNADIATKGYVDNTAGSASNTASTLVRRSSANAFAVSAITGLGTPTTTDNAANKAYVDNQDAAFRRVGTNAQAATAYTFALTDEGKVVYYNTDNSAVTYTIPTNATVAFPTGAWIDIYQGASGAVTIQGAAGVTLRGPDGSATVTLRGVYSKCRITKSNTDTWQVVGDIQTISTQATTNATASPTVGTLVKRDASGRAQVVDPAVAADIATKNYVDTHVPTINDATTTTKGIVELAGDLGGTAAAPTVIGGTHHTHTSSQISDATASATASTVVIRDASGNTTLNQLTISQSTPQTASQATRKDYVDGKTWPSSAISDATSAATASKIILRDANGRASVADPSVATDIATKNYVDTHAVPSNLTIGTVTTGAAGSAAGATITGTAPNQQLSLTIPQGIQGTQGATGATGNGVLFLNAGDAVPAGTPANTVIYRPNTVKTSSFFWGSGTAFPTSTAKGAGDTFLRTDHGTNGTLWSYTAVAGQGSAGWIPEGPVVCTSTTRPTTALFAGFQIYETDTFNSYTYANGGWQYSSGPTIANTEVTYQTGFAAYNDGLAQWTGLRYSRTGAIVTVSGAWQTTASVVARQLIATLPTGCRPPFTVQDNAGGLIVWSNGQVVSTSARSSGFVTSSTITWSAAT